jgi:hypothetical protein
MFLLVGDSRVQDLPLGPDWHTEAFPGATAGAVLDHPFGLPFLWEEDTYISAYLVVGANDPGGACSPSTVSALREQCPRLVIVNPNASCPEANVSLFVPTADDGVHLVEPGRRVLARALLGFTTGTPYG